MLATLYAVAMLVLLVYGLNLLWLAVQYARADRTLPGSAPDPDEARVPDAAWPDVTVQLPLYNEPMVAGRLIDACAALDYPRRKLEIQVLDDSTDETTSRVAHRVDHWQAQGLDIVHIQRSNREGYKAGALQNGLRLARGSFIAIFDADFLPAPEFLARILPAFTGPEVGMVQARWGHLNAADALLTRLQALGLDTHFAVEQYARNHAGCFINFNGTAGVWRRGCIEDAGGWQTDTLTEDLDLSYRAQLRGWQFRYLNDLEVPAELPPTVDAFRTQQHRWTKGAAETAVKLLGGLWRSRQPIRVKVEGSLHLTTHFVFPFVLVAALLHAPLLVLQEMGRGPGEAYFALMGVGLLGFAGFALVQLLAQRALYPDWRRRILLLPLFMAGSVGMAVNNTRALIQAVLRRRSPFVRTPKYNTLGRSAVYPLPDTPRVPLVVGAEAALAVYCSVGVPALLWFEQWAALPFQLLFAVGFGLLSVLNIRQWKTGRARTAKIELADLHGIP